MHVICKPWSSGLRLVGRWAWCWAAFWRALSPPLESYSTASDSWCSTAIEKTDTIEWNRKQEEYNKSLTGNTLELTAFWKSIESTSLGETEADAEVLKLFIQHCPEYGQPNAWGEDNAAWPCIVTACMYFPSREKNLKLKSCQVQWIQPSDSVWESFVPLQLSTHLVKLPAETLKYVVLVDLENRLALIEDGVHDHTQWVHVRGRVAADREYVLGGQVLRVGQAQRRKVGLPLFTCILRLRRKLEYVKTFLYTTLVEHPEGRA